MSRTDLSCGAISMTVLSATSAASRMGYPKTPVEMAGKAMEVMPCSSASLKAFR